MAADPYDTHYGLIAKALADGRVIPFLGAGASLCGRPAGSAFKKGQYLPSGLELTEHLARQFAYPAGEAKDLLRVSQYAYVMLGSGPLYQELHDLLDEDYPVTPLHDFLARLPATLRARQYKSANLLIITTNYDDLMERAFAAAQEPFDLVCYVADGENRGKFIHTAPEGVAQLIEKPNEYGAPSLDRRSVVLKIHGAVNRANPEGDSFVITEDHYIDYLTRTDIASLIPVTLTAKLRKSHFLFMGYSLADWNMRVILKRIWGNQQLTYKSWAIQKNSRVLDQEFWKSRNVEILDVELAAFVASLDARLRQLPAPEAQP
jgi:SIR2-like protein